jgi:hypothetical protein
MGVPDSRRKRPVEFGKVNRTFYLQRTATCGTVFKYEIWTGSQERSALHPGSMGLPQSSPAATENMIGLEVR